MTNSAGRMSPAAASRLRNGSLGLGALLVVLVLGMLVAVVADPAKPATEIWVFLLLVLLVGGVLLAVGIDGYRRAHRFERLDRAFAAALTETFDELLHAGPYEAYRGDETMTEVRDARLVEIDRHFDQRTVGNVAGSITHQLSLFGAALGTSYRRLGVGLLSGKVNGISSVDLALEETTRDNLMGDALFAVFEGPGPAGDRDVYRTMSVSASVAAEWVGVVVYGAAERMQGRSTHAGATVLDLAETLIDRYAPHDISYATDRLRAQAARAPEQRDVLTIRGTAVGRNALLASTVQVGQQEPLLLFPVQFPKLFALAIAQAAHRADLAAAQTPALPLPDRAGEDAPGRPTVQ